MTCLQDCQWTLNYLKRWKERINHIQQPTLLLQRHEATLHTGAATATAIESIILEAIPHPPFSTDLTLSEALKKHLKGNHFTCYKVQAVIRKGY
jgi:hypothetical protein